MIIPHPNPTFQLGSRTCEQIVAKIGRGKSAPSIEDIFGDCDDPVLLNTAKDRTGPPETPHRTAKDLHKHRKGLHRTAKVLRDYLTTRKRSRKAR